METYPIMLKIEGKAAVVVGGGQIAFRKIVRLIQSGANVTVVSPELHPNVENLFNHHHISWRKKEFEPMDLEGAWIVIAATNRREVNQLVASSTKSNQLLNVVDDGEMSTYQVPAKLTRGKLTISVATDGASPRLAKVIRNELAEIYDDTYVSYLNFLTVVREKIKNSNMSQTKRQQLLQIVTNKEYRESKAQQHAFLEMLAKNEATT